MLHIEKRHPQELADSQLNAEQILYKSTHGTIHGKCMCGCGRDTEWNYKTGKPYKVSPDPSCKKRIADIANARNMKVYGKEKVINDPDMQRKMLEARKISSSYTFHDGGKVKYTGALEKNFLQFCDKILELESRMVLDNPEVFHYYDSKENRDRFYIPDYYLPDYNLIIEIKPGGDHPNANPAYIEETRYKEFLKDEAMRKQTKFNYLKIVDKQYGAFVETLFAIVHGVAPDDSDWNGSVRYLKESATNPEYNENFITETFVDMYVIVATDDLTENVKVIGMSESLHLARIYVSDGPGKMSEVDINSPIFENCDIRFFRYLGSDSMCNSLMNEAIGTCVTGSQTLNESVGCKLGVLNVLNSSDVKYNFGGGIRNTDGPLTDFVEVDIDRR